VGCGVSGSGLYGAWYGGRDRGQGGGGRCGGMGVQGSGFGVQGAGCRVQGAGCGRNRIEQRTLLPPCGRRLTLRHSLFRVQDSAFWSLGLRLGFRVQRVGSCAGSGLSHLELRFQVVGFRVQRLGPRGRRLPLCHGLFRVQGSGFTVWGLGFDVSRQGFRICSLQLSVKGLEFRTQG
jgi:hypothetical protein